jgi:hypothetical protein
VGSWLDERTNVVTRQACMCVSRLERQLQTGRFAAYLGHGYSVSNPVSNN